MNVLSYAKRLTALILCAVLLLGLMPMGTFAAEAEGETTAPTGETVAPADETTAPADETTAPADETTAPADETTAPADETTAPADETTAPADETTTPADETTTPTDGLTAPTDGLTAPIDETAAPNAETTAPTDETTAPTEAEPVAQDNGDGTVTIPGSTVTYGDDEGEQIFKLVSAPTDGGTYLIVNTNAAGSGYALLNNNGEISAAAVSVLQGDAYNFIVMNDSKAEWGASTGWKLTNNGYYLAMAGSSDADAYLTLSTTDENNSWTYNNNQLYFSNGSCSTRYLTYSSGWSVTTNSSSAGNVYFYELVDEVATVTIPDVTYGVNVATADGAAGSYTAQYVTSDTTLDLTASIGTDPTGYEANAAGGTYVWSSSDASVATVDPSTGKLSFTGKGGSTTVRVTYTKDGYGEMWGEILIIAEPAGYRLQIVDAEGNSLDGTIAVKGQEAIDAGLDLDALVTYETSATNVEEITGATVTWTSSNESIATIDADGKLTFHGPEGVITVTATYTADNGEVYTDTINVSVSKSLYYTPNDGTNDFPEYPNEGAIRIDKNAQAVGNFSETGVAKVELSMTGVPYSAGNEIDVVIMVDMSNSMKSNNGTENDTSDDHADRVTPARNAANSALEAIVKNEDGTINNNRVAVYSFNGYDTSNPQNYANAVDEVLSLQSYQNTSNKTDTTKLTDAQADITDWIQDSNTGSGTNYGAALEKCYSVLQAAREENPDRKQFVIFVTDGEPTTGFAYETEDGTVADDGYSSQYNDGAADKYYTYTEYYSKQMRAAGVEVYSVGIQLDNDNANTILKKIGGNSTGTAYANADTHGDYAQFITSDENAEKLVEIFENIVNAIKEAATDVTVTDKITDEYTLILEAPENVALPDGTALTIDVLQYTLDENKNRTGDPVVIESVSLTDTDKVTLNDDGSIAKIEGEYFTYDASTHIITWEADKLDTTELALSYYVYLENSAGTDEQVAAGTYPTNEYATIEYTNHLDHVCKKEFPVPQLTWNGAQVSYTFYLVNSQGQPVNRAGRVIPFAEAIYVTDVYTESVTWDTDEDKALSAQKIAAELLPDVYTLYDPNTAYTINVYEDASKQDLGNYFVIAADKTTTANGVTTSTTKVFNTKNGTIYSAPGTYNAAGGENITQVHTGFDFANTTVAFAVVWKNELAEDTIVMDFGLDVVIDVTTNDALEAKVVGVRADQPDAEINSGNFAADKAAQADVMLGETLIGSASVESQTSVRFALDKENGTQFSDPVTFYYESEASYYNSSNVLQTVYLYSSVTVIPATTIYYEDDYLDYEGGWTEDTDEGTAVNTQQQDRPGVSQISADLDADNVYGYDASYTNMSGYSNASAQKITVTEGNDGIASFDFYGTGFDVISMTDATTGTIIVQVFAYDEDGTLTSSMGADGKLDAKKAAASHIVDTYYGYQLNYYKRTYVYNGSEWVMTQEQITYETMQAEQHLSQMRPEYPTEGQTYVDYDTDWVVVDPTSPNALYQVPVMKISGLDYGKYYARIIVTYDEFFDNQGDGAYDFYLDAIRIYDPTGNENDDANAAYVKDGEGWPIYEEVRNYVIDADTFNSLEGENTVSGIVFMDGLTAGPGNTGSVATYASYGPNNELYLAPGQAIAFELDAVGDVAKVQMALKTVGGDGAVKVYGVKADGTEVVALDDAITTATDLYYDITDLNNTTVVIVNEGASVISITNVKTTFNTAPEAGQTLMLFSVSRSTADTALMSLRTEEVTPEVTEPETDPTETEPEVTETEPEVTETEPEVTETEPEVTETEPEVTETEPEVTETEPETEPTEPEVKPTPEKVVETIVKKIVKFIGGWFGKFFP